MEGFAGQYYMWPEEYELLAKYVELSQGDYLEIGSMCGIIAVSLAERYPQRNFCCVDSFSAGHGTIAGLKEIFLRNVAEHGTSNVKLIEGDSLQIVPTLSQTFGVAFIDGNHAYDFVLGDAINCWRILRPDGVLIFHDYDCVAETTQAVHDFTSRYSAAIVEAVSGLAVVRRVSDRNEHPGLLGRELQTLRATLREKDIQLGEVQLQCDALGQQIQVIQQSLGWRTLNLWRRVRDWLAPTATRRRRLYDRMRNLLTRKS
jgi:precorrin-6B methylase 2